MAMLNKFWRVIAVIFVAFLGIIFWSESNNGAGAPIEIDLGRHEAGSVLHFDVELNNDGFFPYRVTDIVPSCSCVFNRAHLPMVFSPRKAGVLPMGIEMPLASGEVHFDLTIICEGTTDYPRKVRIKTEIVKTMGLSPRRIIFFPSTEYSDVQSIERSSRLEIGGETDRIVSIGIGSDQNIFDVSTVIVEEGSAALIKISHSRPFVEGEVDVALKVKYKLASGAEGFQDLGLCGRIDHGKRATPDYLILEQVREGRVFSVRIDPPIPLSSKIRYFGCAKAIHASLESPGLLRLAFRQDAPADFLANETSGYLLLETTEGEGQRISIPCYPFIGAVGDSADKTAND